MKSKSFQDTTHFGIDFNQAGYEQILKGRLFELYFAREMTRKHGATILEWTSDKGIDNGISVFLAIGFGEDSSNPISVSLFELNELIELSDRIAVKDRGVQLMIPMETYCGSSFDIEKLHSRIKNLIGLKRIDPNVFLKVYYFDMQKCYC